MQRDVIQGPLLDFDPVATTTRGERLTQVWVNNFKNSSNGYSRIPNPYNPKQ